MHRHAVHVLTDVDHVFDSSYAYSSPAIFVVFSPPQSTFTSQNRVHGSTNTATRCSDTLFLETAINVNVIWRANYEDKVYKLLYDLVRRRLLDDRREVVSRKINQQFTVRHRHCRAVTVFFDDRRSY